MRVPFIVFFAVSLFVFVSPNVLAEGALTPYGLQQETSHEDDDAPKKALKFYQKGVSAYNYQQFEEAKEWLNKAIKKYPNYTKAYAKLAEIYLAQKDFDEAKRVYKKIIKVSDTEENVFGVNFKLGKIEKDLGNYDAAGTHFQACLNTIVPAIRYWDRQKEKAAWHLKNCTFAAKAVKYPVKFEPIHLNSNINSKHDEYLPMLTADEEVLMFTRRFNHDTHPNEDFYLSITDTTGVWRQATDLGNLINTKENEGAICVSPDGKVLFFAAKNRPGDLNRGFDLYYCYKKGAEWSKPHNLGMPVNSYYWDSQPSVSADGKSLYFCSRRPGGFGGIDIWVSHLEGTFWSEPENLGEKINTPKNEQSPFIHPDGETLYFSSNGKVGMGDADLYVVRKQEDGSWGEPENLGYPINTKGNENGLVVTASGEKAYYSSFTDSTGLDLYYFDLPKKAKPIYVTYVKGIVSDALTQDKLSATIELIDLESGDTLIKTSSDDITGAFLVTLRAGKNYMYNVNKDGYLFHSENFSLDNKSTKEPYLIDIALNPVVAPVVVAENLNKVEKKYNWNVGQTVILKNVFFETASFDLQTTSHPELNRLVTLLEAHPKMRVEISGHTDSIGRKDYNLTLSKDRAKSVYDYLVKKGINRSQMTYKGYGDTQPIDSNETTRGRAANRRTAFTILEE